MYGMYRTHMLLELVQVLGGTLSSLSSVSVYTETSSQTLQHDINIQLRQDGGRICLASDSNGAHHSNAARVLRPPQVKSLLIGM